MCLKAKTSRFIDEVKLKASDYSYSGLYNTELERSRASIEAARMGSKRGEAGVESKRIEWNRKGENGMDTNVSEEKRRRCEKLV